MVASKKQHILKIYLGDLEEYPYNDRMVVVDSISRVFAMEKTQAGNCVQVIYAKGSYEVYHTRDANKAAAYKHEIQKHGIICIILKK